MMDRPDSVEPRPYKEISVDDNALNLVLPAKSIVMIEMDLWTIRLA